MRTLLIVNRFAVSHFLPLASVRWRVAASRPCSSNSSSQEQQRHGASSMLRHLTSKIKSTGPISVAEYMREVLTNPVTGYYVRNDMLGPEGDFITSPEISQIFGELLGVWCVSEWMGAGSPGQLQLVELGPGRGSLASDVLRVFGQLRTVLGETSVSVHLVEVSPVLSQVQATCLTGECNQASASEDEPCYRHGTTAAGLPCSWYRSLEHVPRGFSIYLAHEFFDALPIHKFQRTERGWREVMVDIDPEKPGQLRFVIIPNPTLACTLIQADEKRQHVEVCPEGGVIIQQLANRIAEDGGAALIADYGHGGTKMDTFRGFKGHQLHDVLSSPGAADLTADVDFSYLRGVAEEGGVACLGPVTQRLFLKNMGIDARLQVLLRNCTDPSTKKQLIQSYDMLTNPSKMGERFHFFSMLAPSRLHRPQAAQGLKMERKNPAPLPVAGFTELNL